MEVTVNRDGNKVNMKVSGRLDTTTAPDFQEAIKALLEEKNLNIEIDCSEMEYTSSIGLRCFLMLQKGVNANGGKLVLSGMQSKVREVFDITGFSSIIKIL